MAGVWSLHDGEVSVSGYRRLKDQEFSDEAARVNTKFGMPDHPALRGKTQDWRGSGALRAMEGSWASIGPPGQEGWLRPKKYREATLAEQTGWWVNYKQRFSLELEPPPASLRGGFAISLEVARSALLARRADRQPATLL